MADAFETILVAWLAFAFLPERPTRSQGGTDGSNLLSSTGESCRDAIADNARAQQNELPGKGVYRAP